VAEDKIIMKSKEFTISDVNVILNMPEKEYTNTLLSLVNLTDKERVIIDMYYFKGLRDIDIAENHGIDPRQVSAIKKKAKLKMYQVWKYNAMAIAFSNLYTQNNS